jgi:hypothetical protein
MLIDPTECKPKHVNTAKSGTQVKVNIKGSVRLLARKNYNQKVSIDISNVFYCPDLAANLLSIKQIISSGADVSFSNNTMTIEFKKEKVHITSVTMGNNLWTVSALKSPPPNLLDYALICGMHNLAIRLQVPSDSTLWVKINSPKSPMFVSTV